MFQYQEDAVPSDDGCGIIIATPWREMFVELPCMSCRCPSSCSTSHTMIRLDEKRRSARRSVTQVLSKGRGASISLWGLGEGEHGTLNPRLDQALVQIRRGASFQA